MLIGGKRIYVFKKGEKQDLFLVSILVSWQVFCKDSNAKCILFAKSYLTISAGKPCRHSHLVNSALATVSACLSGIATSSTYLLINIQAVYY